MSQLDGLTNDFDSLTKKMKLMRVRQYLVKLGPQSVTMARPLD